MADSLSVGLVSPSEVSSASCSSYCSLGTRWKESRTGCPAFLSKFIVIGRNTVAPAEPAEPAPTAAADGLVPDIPDGIPQALADLMRTNHVTATDIQTAVSAKGYFPLGMEITDYPKDFIDGCLIGAWDQLYQVILQERKNIPF